MQTLFAELLQTETSARRQARRQARHMRGLPPGRALEVIAAHADATLRALPELAARRGHRGAILGRLVGLTLWGLRRMVDPVVGPGRAYRVTLLGLHHGIDTVRMLRTHAVEAGDDQLAGWCEAWLETRRRLVRNAEIALLWFRPPTARALQAGQSS
ncbi:MAG TPA: hypothetical protein VL172_10250 [Kofleriaceae bacterium]|nr:hypothetical protein [Kofleriaceae bacterium]